MKALPQRVFITVPAHNEKGPNKVIQSWEEITGFSEFLENPYTIEREKKITSASLNWTGHFK